MLLNPHTCTYTMQSERPLLDKCESTVSKGRFIVGLYAGTQARKTRKSPLRAPCVLAYPLLRACVPPLACLRASANFSNYPTKLRKPHAASQGCDWSANYILSGVTFPVSCPIIPA